jgi:hypothetical protein
MEFLMTYGWALLVVLLVIAVLAYFGMLNPDRFLPDKITVSDNRIQLISTQSNGLIIKNAGSDTLYNLQINMTNHDCKISPTNTIAPGEIKRLILICNDPVTPNSRLKGDIRINYTSSTYGEVMQKTATASYAVRGYYFSSNGLIGYWPFDNDMKNVLGNGYDGTCTNCPVMKQGKVLNAYEFDGSNDVINIPSLSIPANQDFTMSAFFNSQKWENLACGPNTIFYSFDDMLIGSSDGYVSFQLEKEGTHVGVIPARGPELALASAPSLNVWHHLAAVRRNNILELYIDGIPIPDPSPQTELNQHSTTLLAGTINIGGTYCSATTAYAGMIDEVYIFNRALSVDEVKALYQSGR